MRSKYRYYEFYMLIIVGALVFPLKADAYIDPNTGGIFFTSVLPFVYAILAAVVIFWKRIVNAIRNLFSKNKDNGES